jgi:hypothetical protein
VAVAVLGIYFVVSKINTAQAFLNANFVNSFFQLFIFGTVCTYIFLFIFSHEKFFPFVKEIEKKEEKKEKKYLKKYLHHGKVLGTFIIGVLGGPVFLSLTTRLLLNTFKYKFIFVFITSFFSTLLTLSIGKGILKIFI